MAQKDMSKVNRKFDVAAFSAIVEHVMAKGELRLPFNDESTARRIRLQFYLWRKREQELNGDPSFMSDLVARVDGCVLTFGSGFGNPALRNALAEIGVVVNEEPDLEEEDLDV